MPPRFREAPLLRRLIAPALDVVGDVHGCLQTLAVLLERLGYVLTWRESAAPSPGRWIARAVHPEGRVLVFVGDLVDRGVDPVGVLRSVHALTTGGDGHAMVLGNHDLAAMHWLNGTVRMGHGFWVDRETGDALSQLGPLDVAGSERARLGAWLAALPVMLRIAPALRQPAAVVVTHAGWPLGWRLRSGYDRERVPWGILQTYERETLQILAHEPPETWDDRRWPGWVDERWDARRGPWMVVGHTALTRPVVRGRVALIDTGAAYGGELTAFRWPEATTCSVAAQPSDVRHATAGEATSNDT